MNFPFDIARRYLFGKKSTNSINIITGVSVVGISIGAAALILILSVFNGFEDLLQGLLNTMNADVRITIKEGKTFSADTLDLIAIANIDGIESVSQTLEEIALIDYGGNQDICTIKGVDNSFRNTTTIDSAMIDGMFILQKGESENMVLGAGIASRLNVDTGNPFDPVTVYSPKRKRRGPLDKAFKTQYAYPVGLFSIKQDYDFKYVFASLPFVQKLVEADNKISALEIRVNSNASTSSVISQIKKIAGDRFLVQDRFQQDGAFFKLMNIEKWISYAIISLTLIIVSFNLVGALWMIVLDKKKDISILKSMGATNNHIKHIFLNEGLLISILGLFIGFGLALLFYFLQTTFGIVPIPEGFVVDAYPISIRIKDFLVVGVTVLIIGRLASLLPARRAARVTAFVREE